MRHDPYSGNRPCPTGLELSTITNFFDDFPGVLGVEQPVHVLPVPQWSACRSRYAIRVQYGGDLGVAQTLAKLDYSDRQFGRTAWRSATPPGSG
jgi:hypothetical protein